MKLKISILLNLLLLGSLIFLSLRSQAPAPIPAIPPVAQTAPQTLQVQPQPVIIKQEIVTVPFHWSQLVSTNNYRIFVANLRASGCPESTVEDIVRGDTERVFSMMRERTGVNGTDPGPWSGQAQIKLVAYLLGETPVIGEEKSIANGSGNEQTEPATLAAFLQNVDVTAPGMSPDQAQETADLRESFLSQLSTPALAPDYQAHQLSPAGSDNSSSSRSGTDNSQTPEANTDDSQSSQSEIGPSQGHKVSPAMLQAEEAESVMGGLFGLGAAIQYDQYRASQAGQ